MPRKSPQRFHKRSEGPVSDHRRDPLDQGISSLLRGPHRLQVVLEYDAMGVLLEGLPCKPAAMALCPVLPGRVAAAMPKQEGEQLLACTHQVRRCIHSGSDQIAKRLVSSVWNPDWCQVPRAVQDGQLL